MNNSFRGLTFYKKAFSLTMYIFELTKSFPSEEKYGLVTQIRKSSRSACSSISDAYRKRLYEAHFISKVSDSEMENSETQVWLDFSIACKYIDWKSYETLYLSSEEIGRLLNHMILNPEKYLNKKNKL
ncbi:MAG TPA: four helix bundle protein [Ignavibacteriaceae bacterium]|nr:four helix bundle protein [Ignavibacteriaceae bacterium]